MFLVRVVWLTGETDYTYFRDDEEDLARKYANDSLNNAQSKEDTDPDKVYLYKLTEIERKW